jgi:exodeoxyribonuclease V alpha subunit
VGRNPVDPQDPELQGLYGTLFSDAVRAGGEIDWQAIAAAKALRHPLCLIAGGPGTGKTTTVTRVLALLLAADPGLRVALAAPTGKAAQRLGESIASGRDGLRTAEELRRRIPTEAKTLHRLLGYSQATGRFRHGPERPLPLDLLVIDEASMIDLLLFDAALGALPFEARLILLGDPDQLASVETGFVFGDLCAAGNSGGLSTGFVDFASTLGIQGLKPDPGALTPLAECVVRLRKVHRFAAGSGIAALSAAIREGRAEQAAAIPDDPRYPEVEAIRGAEINPGVHDAVIAHAEEMCAAKTPGEVLERLTAVQVLSPTHHGARGTRQLNARIEMYLLEQGLRARDEYFQGRPILVTTNDYDIGLFNGDLGVCWKLDGRDHVCFRDDRGGVRAVPLPQLPPHESAWAMTVHKSQGSEFEHVVLVLPDTPSELMTRELIYTAVTRARKRVTVLGEPEVIAHAVRRPQRRESGLRARLE